MSDANARPRYPFVCVDVTGPDVELASSHLFDLGALGIEEKGEASVVLLASFETEGGARAAVRQLPEAWSPRFGEVVGDDWRDQWKHHFEPFVLCNAPGTAIVVRPPWRAYSPRGDERVVVLEPGRAFGTGLHETTRLVAAVLADMADRVRGSQVLDVGCGSGILALTALALGAASVRAIDVDPDAVATTGENAERNGWVDRVDADTAPLDSIERKFAIVVANIESGPLIELASAIAARVAPGGTLVLSGILSPDVDRTQWDEVRRAYVALTVDEVRHDGEWIAGVLRA